MIYAEIFKSAVAADTASSSSLGVAGLEHRDDAVGDANNGSAASIVDIGACNLGVDDEGQSLRSVMSDSVSGSAGLADLGRSSQEPAVLGDVQRSRALCQVDGRSVVHSGVRSNAHGNLATLQSRGAHGNDAPGGGLSLQLGNLQSQALALGVVGLGSANIELLAEVAAGIAIGDDEVLFQLVVAVNALNGLAQGIAVQSASSLEVPLAIDEDDIALSGSVDVLVSTHLMVVGRLSPASLGGGVAVPVGVGLGGGIISDSEQLVVGVVGIVDAAVVGHLGNVSDVGAAVLVDGGVVAQLVSVLGRGDNIAGAAETVHADIQRNGSLDIDMVDSTQRGRHR